jgi:xylan 1,4-beta-xylosidase
MEFRPEVFQSMAGLVLMLGSDDWYYLRKYWSESLGGPELGIMTCAGEAEDELLEHRLALRGLSDRVFLAAEVEGGRDLAFSWSLDGRSWENIGPVLDFTRLSDECSTQAFSGTFCGLCVQDLSGAGAWADFDYFGYEAR